MYSTLCGTVSTCMYVQFIKSGRLRHFPNIHGGLGGVYQTPCVVFTGHPSLRCGDAVHFMEAWGNSPKNCVIFTGTRLCVCMYCVYCVCVCTVCTMYCMYCMHCMYNYFLLYFRTRLWLSPCTGPLSTNQHEGICTAMMVAVCTVLFSRAGILLPHWSTTQLLCC